MYVVHHLDHRSFDTDSGNIHRPLEGSCDRGYRRRARLSILTTAIKQRVNERMQADVVQDVLVEDFNYVSKEEFQQKP